MLRSFALGMFAHFLVRPYFWTRLRIPSVFSFFVLLLLLLYHARFTKPIKFGKAHLIIASLYELLLYCKALVSDVLQVLLKLLCTPYIYPRIDLQVRIFLTYSVGRSDLFDFLFLVRQNTVQPICCTLLLLSCFGHSDLPSITWRSM